MIPYLADAIGVFAVAGFAVMLFLTLTRPSSPLRIRRGAEVAPEEPGPVDLPPPKIPRDTSRPYPRPKGSRSKLNRVCPVCGTGRETGDLDGRVLGWPSHASCAEWLGDWKPPTREIRELQRGLDDFKARYGGSPPLSLPVPSANPDGSYPIASADDLARAQELVMNGLASVNEVRERIVSAFSVPDLVIWSAAGDRQPLSFEARSVPCPDCGTYFEGTAQGVRQSLDRHRGSARCAEHRKLRNLRAR